MKKQPIYKSSGHGSVNAISYQFQFSKAKPFFLHLMPWTRLSFFIIHVLCTFPGCLLPGKSCLDSYIISSYLPYHHILSTHIYIWWKYVWYDENINQLIKDLDPNTNKERPTTVWESRVWGWLSRNQNPLIKLNACIIFFCVGLSIIFRRVTFQDYHIPDLHHMSYLHHYLRA